MTVSSSSPSWPKNTSARSEPSSAEGPTTRSAIAGSDTPTHLPAHTGRVGERSEEVERGGRAQLASHRRGEAHGRRGSAGRSRSRCPPRGRTAPRRRGRGRSPHRAPRARRSSRTSTTTLAHRAWRHAHRRRPRRSRPSSTRSPCPARSPPVPHVSMGGPSRSPRSTRSANSSIVRTRAASSAASLALGPQPHRERGDLGVGRLTGEDRRHRLLDQLVGQLLAPEQAPDDVGPQRGGHAAEVTEGGSGEAVQARAPPPGRTRASGGLAAPAHEAATFALREPTPHALLLPGGDGVLEARLAHRADAADRLRASAAVVGIGRRVEELGIGPQAAGVAAASCAVMMSCSSRFAGSNLAPVGIPPARWMRSRTPVPERRLAGTFAVPDGRAQAPRLVGCRP